MFGKVMRTLITPWVEKDEVDLLILKKMINHLIRMNTSALLLTSSSLDSNTLSIEDKTFLYEKVIDLVKRRTSVIAGIESDCNPRVFDLIKNIDHLKFDGYFIIVHYHNEEDTERIFQFLKCVCKVSSKPILVHIKSSKLNPNVFKKMIKQIGSLSDVEGIRVTNEELEFINKGWSSKLKRLNLKYYLGNEFVLYDSKKFNLQDLISEISNIHSKSSTTILELLQDSVKKNDKKLIDLYKEEFKKLTKFKPCDGVKNRDLRNDEICIIYKAGYIKLKTKLNIKEYIALGGFVEGENQEFYIEKSKVDLYKHAILNKGYKLEIEEGYIQVSVNSLNDSNFKGTIYIKDTELNTMLNHLHCALFKKG